MADVLPEESAVDARLREFLAAELRQAEVDFPHLSRRAPAPLGDRPRRRIPAGIIGTAVVVVVALIALGPRFAPSGGTGAPSASASPSAVAPGSSAISALPSPSGAASVAPSPAPSTAGGVRVDCGRISPEACATAIRLVRAEYETDVAGATRIVMDDTCPPPRRSSAGTVMTTICDRLYPFATIVVFLTAGGGTTHWYAFRVVGLEANTPTTVMPWVGDILPHVLEKLGQP